MSLYFVLTTQRSSEEENNQFSSISGWTAAVCLSVCLQLKSLVYVPALFRKKIPSETLISCKPAFFLWKLISLR